MSAAMRLIAHITRRPPDFVIGGEDNPYLRRWFVIPRNTVFNVYLHEFIRSDDDRALHDHPWLFNASWLLYGQYIEQTIAAGGIVRRVLREAGSFKFRWGPAPHRLELLPDAGWVDAAGRSVAKHCWTLFITGPRVRQWGFYCMERGWIHWRAFTAPGDAGAIGKGCDQ